MKKPSIKVNWDDLAREGKQYGSSEPQKQSKDLPLSKAERQVLAIITANPGVTLTDIAALLGYSGYGGVSIALRKLLHRELILKRPEEKRGAYYPNKK